MLENLLVHNSPMKKEIYITSENIVFNPNYIAGVSESQAFGGLPPRKTYSIGQSNPLPSGKGLHPKTVLASIRSRT